MKVACAPLDARSESCTFNVSPEQHSVGARISFQNEMGIEGAAIRGRGARMVLAHV